MKILTWNLRHGGSDCSGICEVVSALAPDVAVLTEFRVREGERSLHGAFERLGWKHVDHSAPKAETNGILVVSRVPFARSKVPRGPLGLEHRWFHVVAGELELGGIYLPGFSRRDTKKEEYWRWLLGAEPALRQRRILLIGDWNTGSNTEDKDPRGAPFHNADDFKQMVARGWKDAWRAIHGAERGASWWSSAGNGFRLDHALLSPAATWGVKSAEFVTRVGDRHLTRTPETRECAALSDHAALLVELS